MTPDGSNVDLIQFDSSFIDPRIDPDRFLRHEQTVGDWKTHQFVVKHPFGSIATVSCYRRRNSGWEEISANRYTVEICQDSVLVNFKFTPGKSAVRIVVRP